MKQRIIFKNEYFRRNVAISLCERDFNWLSHKMLPLSWYWKMCNNNNTLLLYLFSEMLWIYHGIHILYQSIRQDILL